MEVLENEEQNIEDQEEAYEYDPFANLSREIQREAERIKRISQRRLEREERIGRRTITNEVPLVQDLIATQEDIIPYQEEEEIIEEKSNVSECKTSPFPVFPFVLLICAFIGIMCDNSTTPEPKQPQFEGTGLRSGQAYIVDSYSPLDKKIPTDTVCATTGLGISYIDINGDGIASSGERFDDSPMPGYEQYYRDFVVTIDGLNYEVVCEP